MFRIEFFCDDKNLARALIALDGIAFDLKVVPVVNAVKTANGIAARTSGDTTAMFMQYLKDSKIKSFNAKVVREFLQAIGRRPSSYSYLLQQLGSRVSKSGKGVSTTYTVK